jgi:hypothetical protein
LPKYERGQPKRDHGHPDEHAREIHARIVGGRVNVCQRWPRKRAVIGELLVGAFSRHVPGSVSYQA